MRLLALAAVICLTPGFAEAAQKWTAPPSAVISVASNELDPARLAAARKLVAEGDVAGLYVKAVESEVSDLQRNDSDYKPSIHAGAIANAPRFAEAAAVLLSVDFSDVDLKAALPLAAVPDAAQILLGSKPMPKPSDIDGLPLAETDKLAIKRFIGSASGKAMAAKMDIVKYQVGDIYVALAPKTIEVARDTYCKTKDCSRTGLTFSTALWTMSAGQAGEVGLSITALPNVGDAGRSEHQLAGRTAGETFSNSVAALVRAACVGDAAGVAAALKDGANPEAHGNRNITPLVWVITCENERGVEALLAAGARPNEGTNVKPVFLAASMRNPAPLKALLAHGGDPNAADGPGPALGMATELATISKRFDNYEALLAAGADINWSNQLGDSPAKRLVAYGHFDRVLDLVRRGYTCDLPGLGRAVQESQSANTPDRKALVSALEARGLRFPISKSAKYSPDLSGCHVHHVVTSPT